MSEQDSNDYGENSGQMDEQISEEKRQIGSYDTQEAYQLYKQFVKDIQFVQMLADPSYLRQLHIRGYLYDQKFQDYIRGLSYLFQRQWIRLIRHPEGLWNLKSFLKEGFVQSIKNPENFLRFIRHCTLRNQALKKGYK